MQLLLSSHEKSRTKDSKRNRPKKFLGTEIEDRIVFFKLKLSIIFRISYGKDLQKNIIKF